VNAEVHAEGRHRQQVRAAQHGRLVRRRLDVVRGAAELLQRTWSAQPQKKNKTRETISKVALMALEEDGRPHFSIIEVLCYQFLSH